MRVSTIHLRAAADAVQMRGVDTQLLLLRAGLTNRLLNEGEAWLDIAELDRVMRAAVALTGDPALGLHWGEHTSSAQFDLAAPLVAYAPTLRVGIDSLLRFQPVLGDRPELHFSEQGESATFRFDPFAVSDEGHRVRADLAVSAFCRLLRQVSPSRLVTRRITFAHARPSYGAEYEQLFGVPVHFDAAYPGIEFDSAVLDVKLSLGNVGLHSALDSHALRVRGQVLADDSYELRLKRQLRTALPNIPTMHEAASTVGMSERSLRRRLTGRQSSYSALVEETRRELSCELLESDVRSIQEVASALGFASVSAFYRAFKRWTGSTPAEFRKQRR